jgi:hypothetical protein
VRTKGSISFSAGQTIISEGDPGKELYIVEEGRVELYRKGAATERKIAVLETGDFFGEMSVIDDLPRGASARAFTDCKLLAIDHATFDQMIRSYPEVAIRMLRKMSARIRELEADLEARMPAAETLMRAPAEGVKAPEQPPAPEPPTARFFVVLESGASIEVPDKPDIRIGRFDSVTNVKPDIDLSEADTKKTTSRRHAKLVREDGRLFVCEEIGTANGTFVNGVRIGTGVNVPVNEGDELRFGGVKAVLKAG